MKTILSAIAALLFFMPINLLADADSELRAEIIGEQAGKAIASDHTDYEPKMAKEQCRQAFYKTWNEHFKEMGFDTDDATVDSFVAGCMKSYNKTFGK
jgi:pyocin large subunit-like protein